METCTQFMYAAAFTVVVAECLENLSLLPGLKCKASQSSSYQNPPLYQPDKAVDGYLQGEHKDTCSFTLAGHGIKEAWWKLTLRQMSNVVYLEIYFRNSTVNRHTGFSVFVFNDSSYVPPSSSGYKVFTHNSSTCPEQVMNVTVNKATQGIALYNSKNPPVPTDCQFYEPHFATIEICEVKVMGCPSHHYGDTCAPCDPKCHDRQCDAFNGSCIYGCSSINMEQPDCSCIKGYYGKECKITCGHCSPGTHCDQSTGACPRGCEENWTGHNCDECKDYKYGSRCTLNCGHCKQRKPCLKTNGTCENGCEAGWSGHSCIKGDWLVQTPSIITLIVSSILALTLMSILMSILIKIICKKVKLCCCRKCKEQRISDLSPNFENKNYIQSSVSKDDHGYDNTASTLKYYENLDMQIYQNS